MNKNAIFLCSDATFFPLAKGTVLSLNELYPNRDRFDMCFLDIGLEEDQVQWLQDHGVQVKKFDDVKLFRSLPSYFKNYHKSLVVRPFLAKIFPGYDIYMLVDTDIWFQRKDCIETFLDYAEKYAPKIVIVPTIDMTYDTLNYAHFQKENYAKFMSEVKKWYDMAYDSDVSMNLFGRALFSAGIFALHKDSHLWKKWAHEFDIVFKRGFADKVWAIHLSEQSALNKIIYETNDFVPLTATHNYNCHLGSLKRDPDTGRVVTPYPPYPDVGVIHLTYSSKFMPSYIDNGLLYQRGDYLSADEITGLRKLSHF